MGRRKKRATTLIRWGGERRTEQGDTRAISSSLAMPRTHARTRPQGHQEHARHRMLDLVRFRPCWGVLSRPVAPVAVGRVLALGLSIHPTSSRGAGDGQNDATPFARAVRDALARRSYKNLPGYKYGNRKKRLIRGKLSRLPSQSQNRNAAVGPCHPDDEKPCCVDELLQMNYPCGSGKSCHNYLFAPSARAITACKSKSKLDTA